jgi:hypothetical protein
MFQHMAIIRLDPLDLEKNTFCNALLDKLIYNDRGGDDISFYSRVWGFWHVLGMSNICCWPASMASSSSFVGLVLVGCSMRILGFTGFCGCGVDDMVELNGVWAFMCVCVYGYVYCIKITYGFL